MSELYVVATPIGNLGDMSARALEVLAMVDLVAAEDTRHSARLLQHFGINTPLRSYHDHNERAQSDWLLEQLKEGKRIALISDAGTPLISDPGYQLVRRVRAASIPVIPVPGASALVAALCASGLASDRFAFEGFLPAKSKARVDRLSQLKKEARTIIMYESPHRICDSVTDMISVFGEHRIAVIARELTKAYETIHQGTLKELEGWLAADSNQQRGEMVVLVAGAPQEDPQDRVDEEMVRILEILLPEIPLKQAVKLATKILGKNKNEIYQKALLIKDRLSEAPV